jgi:thiol-disulfide isomerase/thioredoxin
VTSTDGAETKSEGPSPGPTRRQKWLGLARDIGIGVAIVVGVQWWRAHGIAAEGLPSTTLTLLDGTEVPLAGQRERPTIVQMEASWCGVCRMEDATIRALAEDHDVLVVASQSGDAAAVRRFAEEHDLDHLRIAVDEDGRLAAQLGISAFPTTIFVDREGHVSDAEVGYTSELGMRARLAWAGL